MVEFTVWQILWNLLLAARWTVVLSLIAFAGGGIVGLALLAARLRQWPGVATAVRRKPVRGDPGPARPRADSRPATLSAAAASTVPNPTLSS